MHVNPVLDTVAALHMLSIIVGIRFIGDLGKDQKSVAIVFATYPCSRMETHSVA